MSAGVEDDDEDDVQELRRSRRISRLRSSSTSSSSKTSLTSRRCSHSGSAEVPSQARAGGREFVDLSLDEDDDEDDGDDNQDGGAEGIDHSDCDEHARRPVYVRAGLENTYAHTDTRSLAGSDVQDVGQRRKRAATVETAEQRARSEAEAEREAKRRKSEQRDETERAWRCEAEQRQELEQRATIAAGVTTAHVEAEAGAKEDEDTMRRALAEIDTDALISSLSVDDGVSLLELIIDANPPPPHNPSLAPPVFASCTPSPQLPRPPMDWASHSAAMPSPSYRQGPHPLLHQHVNTAPPVESLIPIKLYIERPVGAAAATKTTPLASSRWWRVGFTLEGDETVQSLMRRALVWRVRKRRTTLHTAPTETDVQADADAKLRSGRWVLMSETGERFDVTYPMRCYFKMLPKGMRTVFHLRKCVPLTLL